MNRRDLIKGTLAASAAVAATGALPVLSTKLAAQPRRGSARDRVLFDIAKQQLDRAGDAIWRRDIVGIADYGVHSAQERFYFVNLEREEVTTSHVSHGAGSDPEHDGWLNHYSNVEGSNATSRGAYVTWEWYQGRYGTSVRLGGLDQTNDAALRRYIVMHRAAYAEPSHLARWGRMGRSNGCFVFGTEQFRYALLNLSGGRLLYADSLGLQDDGRMLSRAEQLQIVRPNNPSAAQRHIPGLL